MAKKRTGLVILVVVIAIIALSYGAIKYTCTAHFCGLCKNTMGPAYKTWTATPHSSKKNPEIKHHHECMACHSDPGLLGFLKAKIGGLFSVYYQLARAYHLPLEAFNPVHCARPGCHPKVSEIKEEKIIVNHPEHTELMGKIINEKFKCMPCHRGVAHGGEGDPLGRPLRPDHKVCFECHHGDLKKCELCHRDYKKIDLLPHCSRPECHANLGIIKEEKIKVNHPKHVQVTKGSCSPCHKGHKDQGYKLGNHSVCGTKKCHARAVGENCTLCHKW